MAARSRHGPSHVPSHSVEVPTLDGGAENAVALERARARMRLVFLAAFVFAAIAWVATFFIGVHSSETNGIRASWVAIFPTSFGSVGLIVLNRGRPALASLGIALVAGCVGSLALWVFFEGIWPSL